MIAAFVQQAEKYKNEPDSLHKRTVFRALKLLLLRADRTTTKTLLKEEYFPQTLLCLSCTCATTQTITNSGIGWSNTHRNSKKWQNVSMSYNFKIPKFYQLIMKLLVSNFYFTLLPPCSSIPKLNVYFRMYTIFYIALAIKCYYPADIPSR